MSINLSFPDTTYSATSKPSVTTLKSDLTLIENDYNAHVADDTIHFSADSVWPIGSVYIGAVSTNPATLLGFGTWSQTGQGQMIVGYKAGDADFGTLKGTGGAKTATLATTNLPDHVHTATTGNNSATHTHDYSGTVSAESGHTHSPESGVTNFVYYDTNANEAYNAPASGSDYKMRLTGSATGASSGHTHTYSGTSGNNSATHTHTVTTSATTGANATPVSIINPYITLYLWERTA